MCSHITGALRMITTFLWLLHRNIAVMSSSTEQDWRAKFLDIEKQFHEFQEFSKAYEQELEEELAGLNTKVSLLQTNNEKLTLELQNRQGKYTEDVRKLEVQLATLQQTYDLSVEDSKAIRQKVISLEQEVEKLETHTRVLEVRVTSPYLCQHLH